MRMNVQYITAEEVKDVLGIGRSKAYEIIRQMNLELKEDGYNVIKGKVPIRYFQKKYYGCEIA